MEGAENSQVKKGARAGTNGYTRSKKEFGMGWRPAPGVSCLRRKKVRTVS